MMVCKGSQIARENFGKFIYQLQPKTETLLRKVERILIRLYRQNVALLFNQTCLNEGLLCNYIYIYIYMCVCVCVIYIYIYINYMDIEERKS